MAGASVLVLLVTRGDNPEHTEACLKTLLTSSPPKLTVSLLVLTTAPDLHHGVQQWMNTLPGQTLSTVACRQCLCESDCHMRDSAAGLLCSLRWKHGVGSVGYRVLGVLSSTI